MSSFLKLELYFLFLKALLNVIALEVLPEAAACAGASRACGEHFGAILAAAVDHCSPHEGFSLTMESSHILSMWVNRFPFKPSAPFESSLSPLIHTDLPHFIISIHPYPPAPLHSGLSDHFPMLQMTLCANSIRSHWETSWVAIQFLLRTIPVLLLRIPRRRHLFLTGAADAVLALAHPLGIAMRREQAALVCLEEVRCRT